MAEPKHDVEAIRAWLQTESPMPIRMASALFAEVDRLTEEHARDTTLAITQQRKIDRFTAERDRLRIENRTLALGNDAKLAEVDRLRAALERIDRVATDGSSVQRIAREALGR